MNPLSTRLQFADHETVLGLDSGPVTLPIGPAGLARQAHFHDPPTPAELEHAIDLIEEALTRSRLAHLERGELVTSDAELLGLPGLDTPNASLARHDVEDLFQRLASRALGMPASTLGPLQGSTLAAALVIVRELMHHLGFDRIRATHS